MLLGVLVGRVYRNITVSAQNRSILLTEQESSSLLQRIQIKLANKKKKKPITQTYSQTYKGLFICGLYLANVAERELFGRRVEKREALVLGGELVGVVDAVVAGVAEGCLVGGAEHRGLVFVTHITLDLHLLLWSDWYSEYFEGAKEK